jgi:sirohydrochlorin ferrochelatase
MKSTPNNETIGVILVDHGSKFTAANDMLNDVVALFRQTSDYRIVEPAHMELAEPDIAAAFAACVRQGARRIIVHPYFLSPGRHSTTDIPRLVRQAAAAHPGIAFDVTQPLGLDQKITLVILQRIRECIAGQPGSQSTSITHDTPGYNGT